jgi:hypothetical protein
LIHLGYAKQMAQPGGNLEGPLAPRFENGSAMLIAGLGGRYGNENRAQIPDLWQRFGTRYFGRVPGRSTRKPTAFAPTLMIRATSIISPGSRC